MNISHCEHPGAQAPIIFKRGAIAENVPHKGLRLSPQHRVLIESDICYDNCGHRSVLVSAKSLLQLDGVRQAKTHKSVTYVHIAFDSHEILLTNGMHTESFWPGPQALRALSPISALLLQASVPKLLESCEKHVSPAPIIEGKLRRKLVNELMARRSSNGIVMSSIHRSPISHRMQRPSALFEVATLHNS